MHSFIHSTIHLSINARQIHVGCRVIFQLVSAIDAATNFSAAVSVLQLVHSVFHSFPAVFPNSCHLLFKGYPRGVISIFLIHDQIILPNSYYNEKAFRETQTLRARRSPPIDAQSAMAVRQSQNSPARDPLARGAGPPKFNQLEMVTTCTYIPSLVKIDARNFELSW